MHQSAQQGAGHTATVSRTHARGPCFLPFALFMYLLFYLAVSALRCSTKEFRCGV